MHVLRPRTSVIGRNASAGPSMLNRPTLKIPMAFTMTSNIGLGAPFSTTKSNKQKNQVYSSVRNLNDFHNYQMLSSSSRTPLITLWTTSWCSTCRGVAPLLKNLVESGVGEEEGGVGYCTVEFDAPDIMSQGLGMTYMITSVPTLLSFDAQEAQTQTKVHDARKLTDLQFLEEWIRNEARRHGNRGGGGGGGGSRGGSFGGLFGGWR